MIRSLLLIIALLFAETLCVLDVDPIEIDPFKEIGNLRATCQNECPPGVQRDNCTVSSYILGGERDMQLTQMTGPPRSSVVGGVVSPGQLSLSTPPQVSASLLLQYDGLDCNPTPALQQPFNLTADGGNSFALHSVVMEGQVSLIFIVYDQHGAACLHQYLSSGDSTEVIVPFFSFMSKSGQACDLNFGAIYALELLITLGSNSVFESAQFTTHIDMPSNPNSLQTIDSFDTAYYSLTAPSGTTFRVFTDENIVGTERDLTVNGESSIRVVFTGNEVQFSNTATGTGPAGNVTLQYDGPDGFSSLDTDGISPPLDLLLYDAGSILIVAKATISVPIQIQVFDTQRNMCSITTSIPVSSDFANVYSPLGNFDGNCEMYTAGALQFSFPIYYNGQVFISSITTATTSSTPPMASTTPAPSPTIRASTTVTPSRSITSGAVSPPSVSATPSRTPTPISTSTPSASVKEVTVLPPIVLLDSFSETPHTWDHILPAGGEDTINLLVIDSETIGYERDVTITTLHGDTGATIAYGFNNDGFFTSFPESVAGYVVLQYDGIDLQSTLRPTGLEDYDLDAGNANGIQILYTSDCPTLFEFSIYSNAYSACYGGFEAASGYHMASQFLFSQMSLQTCDLSDVGAIVLQYFITEDCTFTISEFCTVIM